MENRFSLTNPVPPDRPQIVLTGVSGTRYIFECYRIGETLPDRRTLYAFAAAGMFGPRLLYVGIAPDAGVAGRADPRHEKWDKAMAAGMTTHRRLGHLLLWTFSGTIVTAYLVYMMIFVWYKA